MKKSEMFDLMIDEVCQVCEVRKEDVISGRKLQAVVEARVLAVQYLRRIGFSNDDIATIILRKKMSDPYYYPEIEEIKSKAKGIEKMFSSYSEHCLQSKAFCILSQDIKEFCTKQFQHDYIFLSN